MLHKDTMCQVDVPTDHFGPFSFEIDSISLSLDQISLEQGLEQSHGKFCLDAKM